MAKKSEGHSRRSGRSNNFGYNRGLYDSLPQWNSHVDVLTRVIYMISLNSQVIEVSGRCLGGEHGSMEVEQRGGWKIQSLMRRKQIDLDRTWSEPGKYIKHAKEPSILQLIFIGGDN